MDNPTDRPTTTTTPPTSCPITVPASTVPHGTRMYSPDGQEYICVPKLYYVNRWKRTTKFAGSCEQKCHCISRICYNARNATPLPENIRVPDESDDDFCA